MTQSDNLIAIFPFLQREVICASYFKSRDNIPLYPGSGIRAEGGGLNQGPFHYLHTHMGQDVVAQQWLLSVSPPLILQLLMMEVGHRRVPYTLLFPCIAVN